jgi:hypothetical protein
LLRRHDDDETRLLHELFGKQFRPVFGEINTHALSGGQCFWWRATIWPDESGRIDRERSYCGPWQRARERVLSVRASADVSVTEYEDWAGSNGRRDEPSAGGSSRGVKHSLDQSKNEHWGIIRRMATLLGVAIRLPV